ncbi:unnamed protein product, partial [Choristocarpus tenellus]
MDIADAFLESQLMSNLAGGKWFYNPEDDQEDEQVCPSFNGNSSYLNYGLDLDPTTLGVSVPTTHTSSRPLSPRDMNRVPSNKQLSIDKQLSSQQSQQSQQIEIPTTGSGVSRGPGGHSGSGGRKFDKFDNFDKFESETVKQIKRPPSLLGMYTRRQEVNGGTNQSETSTGVANATRAHAGWLGDFGPPHTHTVKESQWEEVDSVSSSPSLQRGEGERKTLGGGSLLHSTRLGLWGGDPVRKGEEEGEQKGGVSKEKDASVFHEAMSGKAMSGKGRIAREGDDSDPDSGVPFGWETLEETADDERGGKDGVELIDWIADDLSSLLARPCGISAQDGEHNDGERGDEVVGSMGKMVEDFGSAPLAGAGVAVISTGTAGGCGTLAEGENCSRDSRGRVLEDKDSDLGSQHKQQESDGDIAGCRSDEIARLLTGIDNSRRLDVGSLGPLHKGALNVVEVGG